MSSRHVPLRSSASALAVAGLVAFAVPAAGAQSSPNSHAASSRVTLEFVKNTKDPSNSTLRVYNGKSLVAKYRAGSGLGTAANYGKKDGIRYRDDCASNAGWLPNGTYKPTSFETGRNGKIKGYAIGLPQRKCHTGKVTRSALFIHSEMTKDRKQGPRNGADSPQRWEGVHDYKSNGCIKLHPTHIAQLFSYMNKHGRAVSLTVR